MPEGGGPGTPPPQRPPLPPRQTPRQRSLTVELGALLLIAGGFIGISQLFGGTYVITGSLPAKAPILGVALIAYVGSIVVGLAVRTGRAWLAGVNVAVLTALLYLPAAGRPLILGLVVAHALAAAAFVAARPWFTEMSSRRRPRSRPGSAESP